MGRFSIYIFSSSMFMRGSEPIRPVFQLPIANRSAVYFHIIVVSLRSRTMICALFLSFMRRACNSSRHLTSGRKDAQNRGMCKK
jgi:hypothetical protein